MHYPSYPPRWGGVSGVGEINVPLRSCSRIKTERRQQSALQSTLAKIR